VQPSAEHSLVQLDKAMQTLVDAFQFFDGGNRGWITRADVDAALGDGQTAGAHAPARSHSQASSSRNESMTTVSPAHASRRRFSEMDFDRNGRVSFPEFVAALESWAGIDVEE
jgi:Ca2+-binding EF-hand superfamily protein